MSMKTIAAKHAKEERLCMADWSKELVVEDIVCRRDAGKVLEACLLLECL